MYFRLIFRKIYFAGFCVIFAAAIIAYFWFKLTIDYNISFLIPNNYASWIKHDEPPNLKARELERNVIIFKNTFSINIPIQNAQLSVRSLKFFRVFIDGSLIFESQTQISEWKKTIAIDIPNLTSGEHELLIFVMNYNGPPALLVYSEKLKIKTDDSWISSKDNQNWFPIRLAETSRTLNLSKQFVPTYEALKHNFHYGILLLLIIFAFWYARKTEHLKFHAYKYIQSPVNILRWTLICLWLVLSINSLINAPIAGMDYPFHLQYISYISKNWSLPLATDGAQMFQSPLYYISSALLWNFLTLFLEPQISAKFLKIIPLLCGLGMIEICYRSMLCAFPNRTYTQSIGLLLGGLIPMNLYMSQYIGNEPLAALFSAAAILLVMQIINSPDITKQRKHIYAIGIALGLGLLSKVTVVLLILPVLISVVWGLKKINADNKEIAVICSKIIAIIFIIAGWYYVRNLILLGKPFIGGWDPSRGIAWWQDPGYRSIDQMTSFGVSLVYPIYSGIAGFWDSLYSTFWLDGFLGGNTNYNTRPNWNYSFLLSLPLLSLLPASAIIIGCIGVNKANSQPEKPILLFSIACIIIYLLAIFLIFLEVPTYSSAKATYSMGLIPCYAVLGAKGMEIMSRNTGIKLALVTILSWWALFSYLSFFAQ